ncbi:MAG: DUF3137 domain-containing protein [Candidatus Gastranaerophilales bacterium]
MKYTDLINQVKSREFRDYFVAEMLPVLIPLELKRKKIIRNGIISITFALIVTTIIVLFVLFNKSFRLERDFAMLILACIISVTNIFAILNPQARFKTMSTQNIIPMLFGFFDNLSYAHGKQTDVTYMDLKKLKIYPECNCVMVDDCIEGTYNGLNLKINELFVSKESGKTSRILFKGLMLQIDLHKNFSSHTLIKRDCGIFNIFNFVIGMQRTKFEDVQFEKVFEVYTTNQGEARYLITAAFMARLLQLSKKFKLEVVFYQQKIYFFLDSKGKDKFNLSLNKEITDIKYYQNIIIELANMLSLIDELKLEQNLEM